MTALVLASILVVIVLGSGMAAGRLVRRAAPALMRKPRLAVVTLLSTLGVWLMGLAAIGPMLAWGLSGPSELMPGNTGLICQRCLDAANPLPPGMEIHTVVPVVLLLALPIFLAVAMLLTGYVYQRRHRRERAQLEMTLRSGARKTEIAGQTVTVIPSSQPTAFAVSNRRWGIVVSTALLELLSYEERAAVLAHEAAHVRQRHHTILKILNGGTAPLRWIPLIATIHAAIPHYLEMAADNAARHATSTPVLASALLKIGEKTGPAVGHSSCGSVALHAAGTDRIRHLVAPPGGAQGVAPVSVMLSMAVVLMVSSVVVHLPYLQAVLDGCLV